VKSKKIKLILGLMITSLFVVSASNLAQAYWAWGATWKNPGVSRYVYILDGTFSSAQETTIGYAALQYDSSNTNAISSATAGTSLLNVSGITITTNVTAYANASYKIALLSSSAWGLLDSSIPAITCRNNCDESTTVTQNGGNKASVYLNGGFTFSNYFDFQNETVDFYTVVLHEFGHTHGLGHPDGNGSGLGAAESRSVMHPNWTIKRTLTLDDVYALESIY
jgi:hypothetical protein